MVCTVVFATPASRPQFVSRPTQRLRALWRLLGLASKRPRTMKARTGGRGGVASVGTGPAANNPDLGAAVRRPACKRQGNAPRGLRIDCGASRAPGGLPPQRGRGGDPLHARRTRARQGRRHRLTEPCRPANGGTGRRRASSDSAGAIPPSRPADAERRARDGAVEGGVRTQVGSVLWRRAPHQQRRPSLSRMPRRSGRSRSGSTVSCSRRGGSRRRRLM